MAFFVLGGGRARPAPLPAIMSQRAGRSQEVFLFSGRITTYDDRKNISQKIAESERILLLSRRFGDNIRAELRSK